MLMHLWFPKEPFNGHFIKEPLFLVAF